MKKLTIVAAVLVALAAAVLASPGDSELYRDWGGE